MRIKIKGGTEMKNKTTLRKAIDKEMDYFSEDTGFALNQIIHQMIMGIKENAKDHPKKDELIDALDTARQKIRELDYAIYKESE